MFSKIVVPARKLKKQKSYTSVLLCVIFKYNI
jgi:hypothetical protein